MKQEIEVKLAIDTNRVDELLACQFMQALVEHGTAKALNNTYFDTADLALHQRKMALRVRTLGEAFIQTLKTQGSSTNGLSKRSEWEWPVASNAIDTQLLEPEFWPSDIDLHQLQAQFTTHFSRRLWYLEYRDADQQQVRVEIALDQGQIAAANSNETIAISELELELKVGDPEQLTLLTQQLLAQCPALRPSDVSKAARGYQLLI